MEASQTSNRKEVIDQATLFARAHGFSWSELQEEHRHGRLNGSVVGQTVQDFLTELGSNQVPMTREESYVALVAENKKLRAYKKSAKTTVRQTQAALLAERGLVETCRRMNEALAEENDQLLDRVACYEKTLLTAPK